MLILRVINIPTLNIRKELYDKIVQNKKDATEYVNAAVQISIQKDIESGRMKK
ncbi:MAG TPA: hypothetical protein VI727_09875 [Candidatus Brocadiaceae bacterium]|nr:hypothetical protein [Candidatus Brocadiaceae bacterium]